MICKTVTAVKWSKGDGKSALLATLGVPHGFDRDQPQAASHHHKQVHGTAVLAAHAARSAPSTATRAEADGIFTQQRGERIAVKTADCLPVLFADFEKKIALAVHAGWRGLTGGIIYAAIEQAQNLNVSPSALVMAIGPAISREAFEVGPEVVDALHHQSARLSPEQAALATAKGKGDRWHVDLSMAAVLQALNAGIPAAQIEVLQTCTVLEPGRWHSYRRERAETGTLSGLNWSWITL